MVGLTENYPKSNGSDRVSDKSLPQVNMHLVSFNGETGIPELWPLAKLRPQIEASAQGSGWLLNFHIFLH